jgi:thiamine pyrophosphokinase
MPPPERLHLFSDEEAVAFVVPQGTSQVLLPEHTALENVGIFPLGTPAVSVTTHGLRWDLDAQRLAMGETVSSSNQVDAQRAISITTSSPLLFSADIVHHGSEHSTH